MMAWHPDGFPYFDQPVERDGYQWWYVDAISDDDRYGITLIAFVGSVFSPYYAWARARGKGIPENFCALNVALYGPRGRWALTERGEGQLVRDRNGLQIGPSSVRWTGDRLEFSIHERAAPFPNAVKGRVRVYPRSLVGQDVVLDSGGCHRWWPIAPHARVEVEMSSPGLSWSGPGYFDGNRGSAPLEDGFVGWNWSRAHVGNDTALLYEVEETNGSRTCHANLATPDGQLLPFDPPAQATLPKGSIWRVPRGTRSEADASIVRTLEDTPFYTRSVMRTVLQGQTVDAMHESLDLGRFSSRWVQLLLPFRMPRITR